jgi:hypothetical protein
MKAPGALGEPVRRADASVTRRAESLPPRYGKAAALEGNDLVGDESLPFQTGVTASRAHTLYRIASPRSVHHSLTPQNVMLTKTGTKRLGFGLAKVRRVALRAHRLDPLSKTAFRSSVHDPHFVPIANTLPAPRTYRTPLDNAGVAITSSPIALVATWRNSRPAPTTMIWPSSFDR